MSKRNAKDIILHLKLQSAKDEWNQDRMKRLDFINKRLREKYEAREHINNVNEVMIEYYRVFAKQIKPLPPDLELSYSYQSSEGQKNGELLFVTICTGLAIYVLYKCLK